MIPAIPVGPFSSQTRTVSASSAALDAVERRHLLALRGGPHGQRPARDLVEVEGVQRLRGQQHHVVGDVDDVVDRPLPGRDQARLQPEWRGADRDLGEDAGGEARAELGHLDRDRGEVVDVSPARRLRVLAPGLDPPAAPPRSRGPRGRHPRRRSSRSGSASPPAPAPARPAAAPRPAASPAPARPRARGCPSASPPSSSSETERIIPSEATPRSFALRSFSPPGIRAPGWATATVWPAATLGAPQTIVRSPSPVSTLQTRSRSAFGMLLGAEDLADDEALGRGRADGADPLDLGPGHHQPLGDLRDSDPGVAVLAQP